jgi:glycerol-3-phosphate acyltransferase PlsY
MFVQVTAYLIVALAGYLLGSIPTGYLVAKAKGIDIRTVGSGNIGATNAFRVLGKPAGIFVLLADAMKGWLAVFFAGYMVRQVLVLPDFPCEFWNQSVGDTLGGLAAILGHNYTCWLKFKGGKGIATTAGVYFALAPMSVTIAIAVWIISLLVTRYVSVASIAAAIALPTAVALRETNVTLSCVTIVIGALAIYKHKSNLQRLRAGTESRIQFKKKETGK